MVVRRSLVAQPTVVGSLAHLLLVAEPLQVFGRDVHPIRFLRGRRMFGFTGHEAIVAYLGPTSALGPGDVLDSEFDDVDLFPVARSSRRTAVTKLP